MDELCIYPGVTGALIFWKAAKGLGILLPSYPQPAVQLLQGINPQKVTAVCEQIQPLSGPITNGSLPNSVRWPNT